MGVGVGVSVGVGVGVGIGIGIGIRVGVGVGVGVGTRVGETALKRQRPFLAGFGPPFLLWEMSTPLLNIHWFMVRLLPYSQS
jgi:hypothetical protein